MTNFLNLVREHFDVLQDHQGSATEFGAKDILNAIRTGGRTNSRLAFQKELLVNLENQLQKYCNDVVSDLRQRDPELQVCKVKRENCKGQFAYVRRWCLTMPIKAFERLT